MLFHRRLPPDLVLLHTSGPVNGMVSLGLEVNIPPAAIEAARRRGVLVIAQVNPKMPYTFETPNWTSTIDYFVEVDEPLTTHTAGEPDDGAAYRDRVASHVPNGATMQLGIGAVPDAVLGRPHLTPRSANLDRDVQRRSPGVDEKNALSATTPLTASFVFGSQELADWVDQNPRVRMMRTEVTNDPARIAKQSIMTSVNGALQVDPVGAGECVADQRQDLLGLRGSTDFIVGRCIRGADTPTSRCRHGTRARTSRPSSPRFGNQ